MIIPRNFTVVFGAILLLGVVFVYRRSEEPHQPPGIVTKSKAKIESSASSIEAGLRSAKEAIANLSSQPNVEARARSASNAIKKLCEAGLIDEAWGLIETDPGMVRSWELETFFKTAKLDLVGVLVKLEGVAFEDEIRLGLTTFIKNQEPSSISDLILSPRILTFMNGKRLDSSKFLNEVIRQGLYERVRSAEATDVDSRSKTITTAIDLHYKGYIDESGISRILAEDRNPDPFQRWSLLDGIVRSTTRESGKGALRASAIHSMIARDPATAMKTLLNSQGDQGSWDVSRGLKAWSALEGKAADTWYQDNKSSLNPDQLDGCAQAYMELAMDYKEADGARMWAEKITNADKRAAALAQLERRSKIQTP